MPADRAPVAILMALPEESRPLLRRLARRRRIEFGGGGAWRGRLAGREVIVCVTGAGRLAAHEAASKLFSRWETSRWIGAGFAGALSPQLSPGTILAGSEIVDESGRLVAGLEAEAVARVLASCPGAIPSRFVGVAAIVATPVEKAGLLRALGEGLPAAVDMESAGWAAAAAAAPAGNFSGVVVRTVSDGAGEEIPPFVAASVSASGGIDRGRLARHAMRHPHSVGKLLSLRRRARSCAERLADCLWRFAERGF